MPALIAWDDDDAAPILLLEDLSASHWPPPWDERRIDELLALDEERRKVLGDVDTLMAQRNRVSM